MRWSIRSQILLPLIAIQTTAVAAIAIATATFAARRSERQIVDRLNGVIDALGDATFPYTAPAVLVRMRGLSGAHFAAHDRDGRVTASSLAGLEVIPAKLRSLPATRHIDALGGNPEAKLGVTRYLAASLRPPAGARGMSLLVLYPETN
jgi:hypothetical protein